MNHETRPGLARSTDAIPGVETFILDPPGLGTALRVSIAEPAAPVLGPPPKGPIAIVYTTDADYCFGTVVEAARVGGSAGDLATAIVVGIGYAEESGSLTFTGKRRILDFYRGPRHSLDMGAYGSFEFGGADAFLASLRDHVIPQVERRIRAIDPARRVLLGTSAGAHFAVYALTQDPGLFRGYGLMSPVLVDFPPSPGDGSLVRLIQDLPDGALPPGLRVFLSAGALEEDPGTMFAPFAIISNAYRMRAALARHGATTEFVQFAGETHTSASGAAISRALRFLLPPLEPGPDWQAALATTAAQA